MGASLQRRAGPGIRGAVLRGWWRSTSCRCAMCGDEMEAAVNARLRVGVHDALFHFAIRA